MKTRRYNNLFDSIVLTGVFLTIFLFYCFCLCVITINENIDESKRVSCKVIFSILFLPGDLIVGWLILNQCYGFVEFGRNEIVYKTLLKKKIVKTGDIVCIYKKNIEAMILGIYKSDAYIICDRNNEIIILTNPKKDQELIKIFISYGYIERVEDIYCSSNLCKK